MLSHPRGLIRASVARAVAGWVYLDDGVLAVDFPLVVLRDDLDLLAEILHLDEPHQLAPARSTERNERRWHRLAAAQHAATGTWAAGVLLQSAWSTLRAQALRPRRPGSQAVARPRGYFGPAAAPLVEDLEPVDARVLLLLRSSLVEHPLAHLLLQSQAIEAVTVCKRLAHLLGGACGEAHNGRTLALADGSSTCGLWGLSGGAARPEGVAQPRPGALRPRRLG